VVRGLVHQRGAVPDDLVHAVAHRMPEPGLAGPWDDRHDGRRQPTVDPARRGLAADRGHQQDYGDDGYDEKRR
jgi:hypothetical protein